jgi:lipid II:glycine glycyltransferase (peptidoglycan interpeptide bridge formation enzyme)
MTDTVSLEHVTRDEWDRLVPAFRDLSYRQSGAYAEAAAREAGAACEFVAVTRSKELIGLANLRVKKVPFANLGIAYSNYGPLTARNDEFSAELFGCCLDALRHEYVEDRGLLLRVVPPHRGGRWLDSAAACLKLRGFRPAPRIKADETFVLDLMPPLAEIRKNFSSRWRRQLSKAQRSNIEITRSVEPADFERLEPMFLNLVQRKGFTVHQGAGFFRRVQEREHRSQQNVIHLARHEGELVAGHIGCFVGETAVYLIGAANAKGRELRASYFLQWAVIEYAKAVGNLFYDLGGIDQRANPDVYSFKEGMNGRFVKEIGAYEFAKGPMTSRILYLLEDAFNLRRSLQARTQT